MSGLLRPGGGAEEEWADVLLGAGKVQIPVLSLSQGKILFILSGVQTILIGLNFQGYLFIFSTFDSVLF